MRLEEVVAALNQMPPADRAKFEQEVHEYSAAMAWVPNPGPQTDAYFCEADELFYGGKAGGGKTDLAIGLALTGHRRTLLLRRVNKDALKLVPRIEEILGHRDGYNGQLQRWLLNDKRQLDIAGCEAESDKQRFKGDPHDLIDFDEITDFLESQYRFIIGWNRSTTKGQRCRVVATGNPPTTPEGRWVIDYWGPWLNPLHPRPAKPGELRWFTTINGKDVEVDGPGPHVIEGESKPVMARSRTFIPADLADNPDLAETNYDSVLAALPEEIRQAYRDGRFDLAMKDAEFQVIPTAWVVAAQNRWKENGHVGVQMTAMACDPAGGGADAQVIIPRYGGWFPKFEGEYAPKVGPDTADPNVTASDVIKGRRNRCPVVVDAGGGYGGGVILRLGDNGVEPVVAYKGSAKSDKVTRDGKLTFTNKRSADWWTLREELDPSQEGGSAIALPPDPELLADLTAPTWRPTAQGIQVESKVEVGKDGKVTGGLRKRLGRSTGKGDAVVMCLAEGSRAVARNHISSVINRERHGLGSGQLPRVVMGRGPRRR
jgi:hypothetical protein